MPLYLQSITANAGLEKEAQFWQGVKNLGQGIKNVWQGKPAVPAPAPAATAKPATPAAPAAKPQVSLRDRYIKQIADFQSRMLEMQKTFNWFKDSKNKKVVILNSIGQKNKVLQEWARNPQTSDEDLMAVAAELNTLIKSTQQLANFMSMQGQEDAKEAQVLQQMQQAADNIIQKAGLGAVVPETPVAQGAANVNDPSTWGGSPGFPAATPTETPETSGIKDPILENVVRSFKPRMKIPVTQMGNATANPNMPAAAVEQAKRRGRPRKAPTASSNQNIKLSAYLGSPTQIILNS